MNLAVKNRFISDNEGFGITLTKMGIWLPSVKSSMATLFIFIKMENKLKVN